MSEGEERSILPRHESARADRVVVGNGGILAAALMRAAACMPPNVQNFQAPCGPQGGNCDPVGVTRQSQNIAAATAAGTSTTLTYTFERPFKLAMITVPSASADGLTLTSVRAAGNEMIPNGSVNMGVFSSATDDAGGAFDAPWVDPGQTLKLVITNIALVGASAIPVTVTGATR